MAQTRQISRRELLALAAAGLVAGRRGLSAPASLRVMALGQSLVLRDLAAQGNPGVAQMRALLASADVRFSNLEVAIRGASAKDAQATPQGVVADPIVLDSLRDLSINLLSLANNHSGNLGEAGYLSTIEETRRRGFVIAGTGRTLAEAAQPGYLDTANGRVALVAMASNAVPVGAMATDTRVGVNHVAERNGVVDPVDADRVLAAIKTAAAGAPWVIVYQHDHYWAPDWHDTPEWKKNWCRACIDAGATTFISHGVPLLHGIEIYKGRPIFYGLGNFVFHLAIHVQGAVPAQYQETAVWQSVIADCEFAGSDLRALWLDPITLKSDHGLGEGGYQLHGNPRLAEGQEARDILERLQTLSKACGTEVEILGSRARVKL